MREPGQTSIWEDGQHLLELRTVTLVIVTTERKKTLRLEFQTNELFSLGLTMKE